MPRLLLELEPLREDGPLVEIAATLKLGAAEKRMWWRLPAQWKSALTTWADPFVLAFTFQMMEAGQDVEVRGKVSPSLLANLEKYMAVWRIWEPAKYHPVHISASEEIEQPPKTDPKIIIPFSGGADSCFTLWRHVNKLTGRKNHSIAAALTMHGFDIRWEWRQGTTLYAELMTRVSRMLASLNVPGINITTNFRDLTTRWRDSHGVHLGAAMHLFSAQFAGALIPNSVPHFQLSTIWGSHPLTDPLMSSQSFPIHDDGAEFSRAEKMALLANWKEAQEEIRVCFGHKGNTGNCCVCEKCLRTMLACRVAGVPLPKAFPIDLQLRNVRKVRLDKDITLNYWQELANGAKRAEKLREPWARAIHATIRRAARRKRWHAFKERFVPLRNRLRKIFRGTTLSKGALKELNTPATDRP